MYSGQYNGKEYHPSDLQAVLKRSYAAGVERIIITAGSLSEARAALELARTDGEIQYPLQSWFLYQYVHLIGTLENRVLLGTSLCCQCNNTSVGKVYFASSAERLFCTVGVHPTRCTEFQSYSDGPEAYLAALQSLAVEGSAERKVVAIGECGLDYDRCSLLWLFL